MSGLYVDPGNLNVALVGIAALVPAMYFIRVKGKSAATWFMLAYLLSWVFYNLTIAFSSFVRPEISASATFYLSPLGVTTLIVGGLSGTFLAQAAYRFRGSPFPREANVMFAVSVMAVAVTIISLLDTPTNAVGGSRWVMVFWSLWGVVVIVRRRVSKSEGLSQRDRDGLLAVAAFLLIVSVSETLAGYNLYLGSAQDTSGYILGQILQFTAVLAFPVVYVQYAPEPTTFQVKLVGFVLLVVLAVFGTLGAYDSVLDNQRIAFDEAPAPHTLSFLPIGDGYRVSRRPLSFENDHGADLRLLDDEKAVVDLPFGFPFEGDTLRRVVVSANGAIEPATTPYDYPTFSFEYPTVHERPLIAPWYTDLNPGAGGKVYSRITNDRLIVTWQGVPEWNYFLPYTIQAILDATGRIDFNYAELPFDTYVGATGVLTTAVDAESIHLSGGTGASNLTPGLDAFLGGEIVRNPFSTFDRRFEFKRFLHRQTMPFLRVVLATIVLILLIAPIFFRLSLTKPLDRLLKGMRRVNDGDLAAELPIQVKDEFGNLSMNFNRMTNSLRTYAEEMESLVEERTRELNVSLTTLKSTQAQLVQQEKMASLGALTAGIAHEIKNPLNFVNNFADLNAELADDLEEAANRGEDVAAIILDLKQNAALIAEHGRRADGIVRSMMEHARTGVASKEPVEINEFVEEYVNLAYHGRRAAVPDFDVSVERVYADDVGFAEVIRQDLGRVLVNLLTNAFDALDDAHRQEGDGSSPAPSPIVRVSTTRSNGPGSENASVKITVSDNGPGVPAEIRQHIFDPFFTTKPTGSGTGLGLSLSYDIVTKAHGGRLTLTESSDGGAEFVIELPGTNVG